MIVIVGLATLGAYLFLRAPTPQPSGNYWIEAIGGEDKTKQNYAPSVIVVDDGYVAIGYSSSFGAGDLDYLVVKLDENGGLIWSKTIGGPGEDRAYTVEHTTDGGYFVAGYTTRPQTGKDFLVVKLKADGTLDWSKTIGTLADDVGYSSRQTPDGGYIVVGATEMDNEVSGRDVLAVKLRENGALE
ncbi:MAG: delta-60 repeat domain-containing protein, partial [Candidatus Hadarchaeales archaeon]